MLFRDSGWLLARHVLEHRHLAVPIDELHWNSETQQARECLTRHRPRNYIPADQHLVDLRLMKLLKYSLKSGEISVNVVERSDSHARSVLVESKDCPPNVALQPRRARS
jgi:hypothetical protein